MRGLLDQGRQLVERVQDAELKGQLQAEWAQAEVPLKQAVEEGHRFFFDQAEARLNLSRRRAETLLERFATPETQPGRE